MGAEATRFVLHRDIVCRTSDFFRVACNGDWKESADKTVRLEETAPEIFTIYLGWLYTNEVDLSSKRDQDSTLTIDKDTDGSTYVNRWAKPLLDNQTSSRALKAPSVAIKPTSEPETAANPSTHLF